MLHLAVILCLAILNNPVTASVSIECTKKVALGSIPSDRLQNTTQILTDLLQIQPEQIKFSSYENQTKFDGLLSSKAMNPFILSLHLAYSEHLVLELSADMLWYVISDAVAQYVREHSEEMRKVFVEFESGKKELVVVTAPVFKWSEVISQINQLITNNTKQSNQNLFAAEFTTTTQHSLTATYLARMDSMQNYFSFTVWTLCGIPEIKLMGVRNDWVKLRSKIDELVGLVESWGVWKRNLKEIVGKFIDVYDGNVDVEFWNDIYKVGGMIGSGNPFITGWATHFFPYITTDRTLQRNEHALDFHWTKSNHHFTTNDFNPRISKAPFNWKKGDNIFEMTFFGGLYGVGYEEAKKSVRPIFGYGVYNN